MREEIVQSPCGCEECATLKFGRIVGITSAKIGEMRKLGFQMDGTTVGDTVKFRLDSIETPVTA